MPLRAGAIDAPVTTRRQIRVVLAGGMALGAYQAGALAALVDGGQHHVDWIAGASIGAVNAALIAGSRPERRTDVLQEFWRSGGGWFDPAPALLPAHPASWISAIRSRLLGAPGHFVPRAADPFRPFRSLYDLAPMKERLKRLVDFTALNSGAPRISVAATDVQTGELVLFDTGAGDRIEIDHLLASCGYFPEFAPVEISGRVLGDGGYYGNAPVEALFAGSHDPASCITMVIDLFSRDGPCPTSLEEAAERKNDLLFGNQTMRLLESYARLNVLTPIVYLSYRASRFEAGAEKTFDYSVRSLQSRWEAGARDMMLALEAMGQAELKPLTFIR
jgi:NTE family protein